MRLAVHVIGRARPAQPPTRFDAVLPVPRTPLVL